MTNESRIIFTHKDITCPPYYEIIDNRNSVLDHRLWSELAGMKTLYDRIVAMDQEKLEGKEPDYPDWVYLNHYRRRFDDDCYQRIYIPKPMFMNQTVAQQYAACHNIEDLKTCGQALKEIYPTLVGSFEQAMNQTMLIPYIICICPTGQFKDYFNFLYSVLSRTLEMMGCETYDKVMERVTMVPGYKVDVEGRDNRPEYQARIVSFLAERLATMYWRGIAAQTPVFPAEIKLLEKDQRI